MIKRAWSGACLGARTGHAHEAGEHAGAEGAADVGQQHQLRPGRALHLLPGRAVALRVHACRLSSFSFYSP